MSFCQVFCGLPLARVPYLSTQFIGLLHDLSVFYDSLSTASLSHRILTSSESCNISVLLSVLR